MKKNKDICKKCWGSWTWQDEDAWKSGKFYCKLKYKSDGFTKEYYLQPQDAEVENCLMKLEQIVMEQGDE